MKTEGLKCISTVEQPAKQADVPLASPLHPTFVPAPTYVIVDLVQLPGCILL